jgi:DHA1 family bicyclomycin/chloramphenicol resistance-like MFS transporter
LASTVCALATDIETLIAARGVQALSMAMIAVVPRAVVRDLYAGDQAAHMLSLMGIVLGVAPILAPILGSHLHVWFGWQANFVFVALYGALLLAWVALRLPETLVERNRRATVPAVMLGNFARLLRSRRFVGYMLVGAFTMSGLFAFLAGSAFVFVAVLGQSEQGFGFLFGAVMLGNITGAAIGAKLVRAWGIDRMIARASWLLVISGIALAGMSWAGVRNPLAIVVPMFFYMIALMTTMPQAQAGALTPYPAIAGSASSLMLFVQFVVASSSALAVGLTFDGTPRAMATVIAIASALAFVAYRALIGGRGAI